MPASLLVNSKVETQSGPAQDYRMQAVVGQPAFGPLDIVGYYGQSQKVACSSSLEGALSQGVVFWDKGTPTEAQNDPPDAVGKGSVFAGQAPSRNSLQMIGMKRFVQIGFPEVKFM